jgi:hypothetical protein
MDGSTHSDVGGSRPPNDSGGGFLSLQCCVYSGSKLPDASSCGALCAEFPRCLPPLPSTVADDVAELQEHTSGSRETLLHRLAFLEQLDEAITDGIGKRNDESS